jgi:peptidoglycan/xylan/chitin deacetylase (PgdA/CDA1 family)
MIRSKSNNIIRRAFSFARQLALRHLPIYQDRRIIAYHGVGPRTDTRFNLRMLGEDDLRTQIRHFKREYAIVPLSEIFTRRHNRGKRFLAITFDDGQRTNLLYALPVIKEEEVPATFFVTGLRTTGKNILWFDAVDILSYYHPGPFLYNGLLFRKSDGQLFNDVLKMDLNTHAMSLSHEKKYELIDQLSTNSNVDLEHARSIDNYWKLLDERDLSELASCDLVEIGSHGITHTNLDLLPETQVVDELKLSKEYLERSCGREVVSLAYPNGNYTRRMIDVAEGLAYKFQLAVNYKFPEDVKDPRIYNRLGLYPDRLTPAIFNQVREFYRIR